MKYEIKYIQPSSLVFSVIPLVLFVFGLACGILVFFILANPMAAAMPLSGKLIATAVFGVAAMAVWTAIAVACAFVYNLLCTGVGLRGVQFELAEAGESVSEEAGQ